MSSSQSRTKFFAWTVVFAFAMAAPTFAQADNCFTRLFNLFALPHEENLAKDWMVKPIQKIRVDDQVRIVTSKGELSGAVELLNFEKISVRTSKSTVTVPLKDLKDFEVIKHGGNKIDDSVQKARMTAIKNSIAARADDFYASPSVANEMKHFRAIPKAQKEAYLRSVGDKVMKEIMIKHHTNRIGFHYNLHGGAFTDYIDRGGIQATFGDIALQHGAGDARLKVYFFDSNHFNLFDILNERHPDFLMKKVRMGNLLTPFDLNSKYFQGARAQGGIVDQNSISMTFDAGWIRKTPMSKMQDQAVGVPVTEYLDTPIELFRPVNDFKKIGLSVHPEWDKVGTLSWDEMTLLEMRHLEHRLVDRFKK